MTRPAPHPRLVPPDRRSGRARYATLCAHAPFCRRSWRCCCRRLDPIFRPGLLADQPISRALTRRWFGLDRSVRDLMNAACMASASSQETRGFACLAATHPDGPLLRLHCCCFISYAQLSIFLFVLIDVDFDPSMVPDDFVPVRVRIRGR
jgi:hypothetical protein